MRKRKNNGLRGCVILILGVFCLAAVGGLWAANDLPRWATRTFGSPSTRHGWLTRVFLSAQLYINRYDLLQPMDGFGAERLFEVALDESPTQVAERLELEGLVRNGKALRTYLVYSGLDTSLQAGVFRLSPAWNAVQIAQEMQDATPDQVTFHLLAGWRLEEVAAALPINGVGVDPMEFIQAARNPGGVTLGVEWPVGVSLEGYLSPGDYQFKRDAGLEEVLNTFTSRFYDQLPQEWIDGFTRQGLDVSQAVTLASIIQREAMVQDEMPMIASVFLNRLAIGMKLDSDPTVQYALGYQEGRGGWWTNPLSLDDLQVNSPYNTYIQVGLPPGPISNPSLSALQAVAAPAQSPYYYFRAACDGSGRHNFARTFEEQLQNACP
jgi:UPF0755 protein